MGQYHYVVNLDKKEFLHPHRFGDGLKLLEFGCNGAGTMSALALLLAAQNRGGSRGGGDFSGEDPKKLVGSWAGDRIAICGDYSEESDPIGHGIFQACEKAKGGWKNISDDLLALCTQS